MITFSDLKKLLRDRQRTTARHLQPAAKTQPAGSARVRLTAPIKVTVTRTITFVPGLQGTIIGANGGKLLVKFNSDVVELEPGTFQVLDERPN